MVEAADFHGQYHITTSHPDPSPHPFPHQQQTLHTLALQHAQSVVEAADFHGQYHIGAEFSRALREAAKQLLRDEKLPALAAAADRELWLTWVDSLIGGLAPCRPVALGLGVSAQRPATERRRFSRRRRIGTGHPGRCAAGPAHLLPAEPFHIWFPLSTLRYLKRIGRAPCRRRL